MGCAGVSTYGGQDTSNDEYIVPQHEQYMYKGASG